MEVKCACGNRHFDVIGTVRVRYQIDYTDDEDGEILDEERLSDRVLQGARTCLECGDTITGEFDLPC